MKKVYLVRHAKSSWDNPELRDYDRPLKGRGISDAYLLSQWLNQNMETPEALYSSPATRALHTALIFSRNLNFPFKQIHIEESLYLCSSNCLLDVIKSINNELHSIMIFAHNPTITDFVNSCQHQRIDNVPTAGMVCLQFHIENWSDAENNASLVQFEYPKKLKQKI